MDNEKLNRISEVFISKLPSTKSLYVSLGCLFVFFFVALVLARTHDVYYTALSNKDELLIRWGFYVCLFAAGGATLIPAAPIRAMAIALFTVFGYSKDYHSDVIDKHSVIIENVIQVSTVIQQQFIFIVCPNPQANAIDDQSALIQVDKSTPIQETVTPISNKSVSKNKKATHKKPSPVSIDYEQFKMVFSLNFINKSYEDYKNIISGLESRQWTKTQLCQIALLIFRSNILKPEFNSFREWVRKFFLLMGRDDVPNKPNANDYKNFTNKAEDISCYFRTLIIRYLKTEDSMLILTENAKKLC